MATTKETAAAKTATTPPVPLTLQQKFIKLREAVPSITQKAHSDGVKYKFAKIFDVYQLLTPAMNEFGVNFDIVGEQATRHSENGDPIYYSNFTQHTRNGENYTRLSSRIFTTTVVGKDQKGRKITEGVETYKTPSGVYEIKDWARHVEKAAEADGLLPLLEQIKQHVKEYAWMKNASDMNVLILAAECLTGHAYEYWEGFTVPVNTQADETGQLTFCF